MIDCIVCGNEFKPKRIDSRYCSGICKRKAMYLKECGGKLIETAGVIGKSNLIIDDTPGISIAELRSKCRKYKIL